MADYKDRKKWLLIGIGGFVIVVLFVSLMFLIFSEKKLPDNAVPVSDELVEGEIKNKEMLEKMKALMEKEPVLKELPMTVEYYSEDYSKYTKYTLSYGYDESAEKGFYVIMKDYTGEGAEVGIAKLESMGMDMGGVKFAYSDLTDDGLGARAEN